MNVVSVLARVRNFWCMVGGEKVEKISTAESSVFSRHFHGHEVVRLMVPLAALVWVPVSKLPLPSSQVILFLVCLGHGPASRVSLLLGPALFAKYN